MSTDVEKLKEDTKKLLSKEALSLWQAIEWDKEEVGNSKIGFLNIDLGIKPERIARFINKRAAENKSNVIVECETWLKQIKEKYPVNLPLNEIDKYRDDIVKRYGSKIIPGLSKNLTREETEASRVYMALTVILQASNPPITIKIIDAIEYKLYKAQNFFLGLFNQVKKFFWIILLLLILLAVIKYLFS